MMALSFFGIVRRFILSITVLLVTRILLDCNWGFSFEAAFFAPFLNDLLYFVLSAMDLPLSVGDNGASSSKRPRFDLNLPIASEPEPEPASTSDPKEGVARNRTQEFPSEVLVFSFLLLL